MKLFASNEIKNKFFSRSHVLFLTVCCSFLVIGPFFFGTLPDEEDYSSTVLSTYLFLHALAAGESPFWTPLLGLGLPQPFRINWSLHPLSLIYLFLPPLLATKLFICAHGVMLTVFSYLICKKIRMSAASSFVCCISILTSTTTVNYLFTDDWPFAFVSFSFLPLIYYLLIEIAEEEKNNSRRTFLCLNAGFAIGLFIVCGLASHIMALTIPIIIFWFTFIKKNLPFWRWHICLCIIVLTISAFLVVMLYSELISFGEDVSRDLHRNANLTEHLINASQFVLVKSIFTGDFIFPNIPKYQGSRTIGFGLVALTFTALSFFVAGDEHMRRVKIIFLVSIILMQLPRTFYFDVISATWFFRDSVNFFGLLLFGKIIDEIKLRRIPGIRSLANMMLVIQLLLMALSFFPYAYQSINLVHNESAKRKLVNLQESLFLRQISELIATPKDVRVLFSPYLDQERKTLFSEGFVTNLNAFSGIATVNATARGIATSGLHPEKFLMEGELKATPSNLLDDNFLDVLSISHVIAHESEAVSSSLNQVGKIETKAFGNILVYENRDPFPIAFEADPSLVKQSFQLAKDCSHNGFLCADFEKIKKSATNFPLERADVKHGRITLELSESKHERKVILPVWFREGWETDNENISVFKAFGGLVGLSVPSSTSLVSLEYWPSPISGLYLISTMVIWTMVLLNFIYLIRLRLQL